MERGVRCWAWCATAGRRRGAGPAIGRAPPVASRPQVRRPSSRLTRPMVVAVTLAAGAGLQLGAARPRAEQRRRPLPPLRPHACTTGGGRAGPPPRRFARLDRPARRVRRDSIRTALADRLAADAHSSSPRSRWMITGVARCGIACWPARSRRATPPVGARAGMWNHGLAARGQGDLRASILLAERPRARSQHPAAHAFRRWRGHGFAFVGGRVRDARASQRPRSAAQAGPRSGHSRPRWGRDHIHGTDPARAVGFKSFAGAVELRSRRASTAIVGPNGCGKSNISDAVRWVLASSPALAAVAARWKNVIFQGSTGAAR